MYTAAWTLFLIGVVLAIAGLYAIAHLRATTAREAVPLMGPGLILLATAFLVGLIARLN